MVSKVGSDDHTRWRDISAEEIKKEKKMRYALIAIGAILLIAAITLIVKTYQGQSGTFTHITDQSRNSGHWNWKTYNFEYDIVPQPELDQFITYGTYGVTALIGLRLFWKGIFYDREKALRPVGYDKGEFDTQPDDPLARGYLHIREGSLAMSHVRLAFSCTFYSDPKRQKNLGPLVRAGALTVEQVEKIDDIHKRYESALFVDRQKLGALSRHTESRDTIENRYSEYGIRMKGLEQEWSSFTSALPSRYPNKVVKT